MQTMQRFLKENYRKNLSVKLIRINSVTYLVYDEIGTFGESERLLLVKKEGKYGYQDLKIAGRNSTHIEYDFLENFKNDGAPYIKSDQKGFVYFVEP